jgi:CheY-like chemotaxis protein
MNHPCRGVLIVEDDRDIRETIEQVLEDHEIAATVAENGAAALEQLRTRSDQPCLILLDMMMPVMDGRTFRDEQRDDPALSNIPVVVLSAHITGDLAAKEMQVDGYLKKPCDLETLLAMVTRFCGPRQ